MARKKSTTKEATAVQEKQKPKQLTSLAALPLGEQPSTTEEKGEQQDVRIDIGNGQSIELSQEQMDNVMKITKSMGVDVVSMPNPRTPAKAQVPEKDITMEKEKEKDLMSATERLACKHGLGQTQGAVAETSSLPTEHPELEPAVEQPSEDVAAAVAAVEKYVPTDADMDMLNAVLNKFSVQKSNFDTLKEGFLIGAGTAAGAVAVYGVVQLGIKVFKWINGSPAE